MRWDFIALIGVAITVLLLIATKPVKQPETPVAAQRLQEVCSDICQTTLDLVTHRTGKDFLALCYCHGAEE